MSMTDPIADLLTHIRNATTVRHDRTDVPASKMKLEIAKILKQEGFIRTFKVIEEGPQGTIRRRAGDSRTAAGFEAGVQDLPRCGRSAQGSQRTRSCSDLHQQRRPH